MTEKIAKDLEHLVRPIESVRFDPKNARKHSRRNLESIRLSLDEHGQVKPIVVNQDGVVIAGNGTLEAARELGWASIAAVTYTGDAKAARRLGIQDNRSAELAEWNEDELRRAASEVDLTGTGFSEKEIAELLADVESGSWGDGAEIPQAIQLAPAREYAVVMCETDEDWERLKVALDLQPVRRGGYKKGSAFDSVGTQRVVTAASLLKRLEGSAR